MRTFGITMLIMLVVVGGVLFFKTHKMVAPTVLCGAGVLIFAFSYLLPRSVGLYLYRAWMGLAFVMGWVIGPIMMGIMFFLIITPMGLLRRMLGADALMKNKVGGKSFWQPLKHRTDAASYRRQF